MNALRTKLVTPHIADCVAVDQVTQGLWTSPWFFDSSAPVVLEGRHRKAWLRLRCNDPDCPAVMLIGDVEEIPVLLSALTQEVGK